MLWYAINTKYHQEEVAEMHLHNLGVEVLFPKLRQTKSVRRKQQVVTSPLFPGYLFAKFCMSERGRAVSYATGVRKIVTFGSTPAIVDEQIVESIRQRLHDGYVTLPARRAIEVAAGERIRIQSGPLQGIEAIFEQDLSAQQRVVLLLRAMAGHARVVLPYDMVANG